MKERIFGWIFILVFFLFLAGSNAARRRSSQERNDPNLEEGVSHADRNVDGVVGGRQQSVFGHPQGVDDFGAIRECFLWQNVQPLILTTSESGMSLGPTTVLY